MGRAAVQNYSTRGKNAAAAAAATGGRFPILLGPCRATPLGRQGG
jgi:hypothetical protein